ncbi:MAG TPA: HAD family phosphatase [Candidatus Gracilibacteria bacterium]|nr:HAD family phosphatase [Candidatus Gracilibacteria bacterium]
MTNIRDAEGYIFDLDGTLAVSQHFHFEAYRQLFAENGIEYSLKDDVALYNGQGSEKIIPHIFEKHDRKLSTDQVREMIIRKRNIYKELIEKNDIQAVPGAEKFLNLLSAEKKKIIVATGNRLEPSKKILKKIGLEHFFKNIISVEDISEPKPSPETFLLAMNELGLEPKQCIIFEDAVSGVRAAKAANMYCVGITTSTEKERLMRAGADKIIADYTELLP